MTLDVISRRTIGGCVNEGSRGHDTVNDFTRRRKMCTTLECGLRAAAMDEETTAVNAAGESYLENWPLRKNCFRSIGLVGEICDQS
eukprot:569546-Rhodomonas_salina.3